MIINKKVKYLFVGVLISILAIVGISMYWTSDANADLITEPVGRGDIEQTVLATGKFRAFKQVDVGAQVSGQISQLNVEIGQNVKQGDVLAQIDPRTQKNQWQIAQSALANDQAVLLSKEALFLQAQQELSRQKTMFAAQATSKSALEIAEATYKTAKAAVNQAKTQIKQSQISVDTAKLNLSYTQVLAPIDGTVIAVAVDEGQTLNANQNTPTIVTLAQLETMTLRAEIAEADVGRVSAGMNAYFTLLGNSDKKYQTLLKSVEPGPQSVSDNQGVAHATDVAIYYYGLLDVPNKDGLLRIDMTANVVITPERVENVLMVPMTALINDKKSKKSHVKVLLSNKKIEERLIESGLDDGINVEIKKGLKEGEIVILGAGTQGGDKSKMVERAVRRR